MDARTAEITERFLAAYWRADYRRILDIGFAMPGRVAHRRGPNGSSVVAIDIAPGEGKLRLGPDPYRYPYPAGFFDVIVCTSCLEHDPMFWLTFLEAARVLSDRGVMYVSVPTGPIRHGGGLDCWRFLADAGSALEAWARRRGGTIALVERFIDLRGPLPDPARFDDCVMVFSKDPTFRPDVFVTDMIDNAWQVWRRDAPAPAPRAAG